MNTSKQTRIERLELGDRIYVYLSSGDMLALPYDYTPRLAKAKRNQLCNYHLIGGGRGIHFPEIDEDISLKGIIRYKTSHELLAS